MGEGGGGWWGVRGEWRGGRKGGGEGERVLLQALHTILV